MEVTLRVCVGVAEALTVELGVCVPETVPDTVPERLSVALGVAEDEEAGSSEGVEESEVGQLTERSITLPALPAPAMPPAPT